MRAVVSLRGDPVGVVEVAETMLRRLNEARRAGGSMLLRIPSPGCHVAVATRAAIMATLDIVDINVAVRKVATERGPIFVVEISPVDDRHLALFKPSWLPDARPSEIRSIAAHEAVMERLQNELHKAGARSPSFRGEMGGM